MIENDEGQSDTIRAFRTFFSSMNDEDRGRLVQDIMGEVVKTARITADKLAKDFGALNLQTGGKLILQRKLEEAGINGAAVAAEKIHDMFRAVKV